MNDQPTVKEIKMCCHHGKMRRLGDSIKAFGEDTVCVCVNILFKQTKKKNNFFFD